MDKEVITFVNERLFVMMHKASQNPSTSSSRRCRRHHNHQASPTTAAVKLDANMSRSLENVQSLAQTLLCSAACVTTNHGEMVFQQVTSFCEIDEGDNEGVEIGEENLLAKDYGIYRV